MRRRRKSRIKSYGWAALIRSLHNANSLQAKQPQWLQINLATNWTSTILRIGDSSTQGVGSTNGGGWRAQVFHKALGANGLITFVGPNAAGPDTVDGVAFTKHHAGYSGYKIADVDTHLASYLANYKSDGILLNIGLNNVWTSMVIGQYSHSPRPTEQLVPKPPMFPVDDVVPFQRYNSYRLAPVRLG